LIAFVIVSFALGLIYELAAPSDFDKVLAFAATLIGSIAGYYFAGKSDGS
jgi:hypothetical protein